jgi:hypothetical protein
VRRGGGEGRGPKGVGGGGKGAEGNGRRREGGCRERGKEGRGLKGSYRASGGGPIEVRHIPSLSLRQVVSVACGSVQPGSSKGQVIVVAGVIVQGDGTAIQIDVLL